MPGTEVRYQSDGLSMVSSLHRPSKAGSAPGVLVFPEAFGLGEHAMEKAERLAQELGYVALACDLHGERSAIGMDQLAEKLGPLRTDAARVRARVNDALAALLAQDGVDASRIAAIGYCFGGTMAFELALTGADIKATIGFHSGLQVTSPQDAGKIRGKVMALLGAEDPGIPADQREAFHKMMTDAGVDWQMSLYGGVVHSFTNKDADKAGRPEFLRYDANADRRSWQQMAMLMAEVFG
ncbi:MAG TPA: dienelactone hydrolase family protein [Caulobacteraceae bacterium]|nr:dienelactone hydrolase family protein [Caulobacteraceae bacterium]